MVEVLEPYKSKSNYGFFQFGNMAAIACGFIARDAGWAPYGVGYALGLVGAMLIEYWIPPRSPGTFHWWSLKVTCLGLYFVYGLWLLPHWISKWIWMPLAFGATSFVLLVLFYWFPPLYPVQKKRSIGGWMIISLVLAVGYGTYMYLHIGPSELD